MAFLNRLLTALNEKKANLFSPADLIACEMPKDFYKVQTQYDSILNENNRRDLAAKQEEAKKLLRYAVIASIISEGDYEDKKSDLRAAQKYLDDCQERYDAENKKIIGPNGLNEKIKNIETAIANLQQQTQNEELLADNINRKLRHKVSIELVHIDGEYKGYYNVRSLRTNEVRDVNDVSTGEKNIIAFLYFIEKLNEIGGPNAGKGRVVVFDDPMNSNDDNLQYLIMEELWQLMDSVQDNDCLIVLTHNKHFYINLSYGRSKNIEFIHLLSDNLHTYINYVDDSKKDFKTSYQELWCELIFLYKNKDTDASMLLNPVRRIIETFIHFNSIGQNQFYKGNNEAKKLFNVNSHSIDDLEAELNGKSKKEIMELMQQCFTENNAQRHFETYWDWGSIETQLEESTR